MTIEVPTPSADLISQIETATIETDQAEAQAIAAIRERFAPYAKHNGFIQTAYYHRSDGANYSIDRVSYLMDGARKLRGLLAYDNFGDNHTDQNRGNNVGEHLYLTERGEWIEVTRTGVWTRWQGEASYWFSSADSGEEIEVLGDGNREPPSGGQIRTMTDAEVAAEYDLDDLLEQIGKSMTEMTKKLPARYAKLQQRAELAQRIITAVRDGAV